MQKSRRMLRRRAISSLIDGLVIFLAVFLVMVVRNVALTKAISYTSTPGHIIVQLTELPEFAGSEVRSGQEWVLYGDGTLIFRTDPGDDLWQAHLSPDVIQSMLDVIVNQNQFFATSEQQYGTFIDGSDDNVSLLMVDANGQHKEVTLASKPATKDAIDIQTMHVFAIKQFLLAYHPMQAIFFAHNSDLDGDNGNS